MHELGIAQNVVDIVLEHSEGKPVRKIRLEIGKLSAVLPEALLFCFDACSKGTAIEGAELIVDEVDGRGKCLDCGKEMELGTQSWVCNCGSGNVVCMAGQELRVKELEVD